MKRLISEEINFCVHRSLYLVMIDVLRNDLPQKFLAYPHEKIN